MFQAKSARPKRNCAQEAHTPLVISQSNSTMPPGFTQRLFSDATSKSVIARQCAHCRGNPFSLVWPPGIRIATPALWRWFAMTVWDGCDSDWETVH